jgi:transcription elongation GreA/GreB family factor
MSRAFVKEPDGLDAFEDLPEKLISEHRNVVTETGMALIEAEVARLSSEYANAQALNDRAAIARAARDLRYWSSRRSTAEVMAPPSEAATVHFGSTVTLVRDDDRKQTFQIVGEDEANPAQGTLSYVAPLAQALLGKAIGDVVPAGSGEAEIIAIS